jgi:DNA polymerase-4
MKCPPHPSLLLRKIIHFDMDAFYASIEIRDDPALRGRPVIVGGPPNSRGVVCTASYEARKYGVRSAMACAQAARLCPEAVFIRPNFEKYSSASQQIRAIFRKYTPLIQPLSLDEAYLDVTDNVRGLYAVKIARLIQDEVFETLSLTGSAGVAPNKLLAKIASDIRKPRGLTVVLPEQAEAFMGALPLRKIHGIGPKTEQRLAAAGLATCRDVWGHSLAELEAKVGNMAEWLMERSRGLDDRPVETGRERKSLGHEETFAVDMLDLGAMRGELAAIARSVAEDLRDEEIKGRTITLKVRYGDFTRITRSQSLPFATDDEATIRDVAQGLLGATEAGRRRIRLLGIALSNLESEEAEGLAGL